MASTDPSSPPPNGADSNAVEAVVCGRRVIDNLISLSVSSREAQWVLDALGPELARLFEGIDDEESTER